MLYAVSAGTEDAQSKETDATHGKTQAHYLSNIQRSGGNCNGRVLHNSFEMEEERKKCIFIYVMGM